ncbi:zinc finger Y-chromosomal protein 2 [Megalopta genalis]|uniref:zinc finger Y-chromosomal protein 2 n=1 Tax=Megalopta genalis TaxID=115081 RepID=UPI003FD52703
MRFSVPEMSRRAHDTADGCEWPRSVVGPRILDVWTQRGPPTDDAAAAEGEYACAKCKKTFPRKYAMNRHYKLCDAYPRYQCPHCKYVKFRPIVLGKYHGVVRNSRHMLKLQTSLNRRGFPCPRCARTFHTSGGMSRHYRLECVDLPRFKCPHCDMRSKYTQAVYRHIRAKHRNMELRPPLSNEVDGWFRCPRCTNSFLNNAHLLRHYRTHCDPNEIRFRCTYCDYGSKYSSNVYKHVRRVHKQMLYLKPQRMYQTLLDDTWSRPGGSVQRHVCPRCYSSFSKKANMLTHFRRSSSTERRPGAADPTIDPAAAVDSCLRRAGSPRRQASFILVYALRASYKCHPLSSYDTSVLDMLRSNMDYRLDGGDVKLEDGPWQSAKMSYHCPRCNAGYTYKKTLKTHMKYDCGKEPRFKCPYCNKRDKCSSNIYKHVRMRHDGLPVVVDRN